MNLIHVPTVEYRLRFAPDGETCGRCGISPMYNGDSEGTHTNPAIHTVAGRSYCADHSPYENIYIPCTRCGTRPVINPNDIEIDPVCFTCQRQMRGRVLVVHCRGCGKNFQAKKLSDRICEDCASREEDPDQGACPGYGEYCGNSPLPGSDLCGDCLSARLDNQSPRIPK